MLDKETRTSWSHLLGEAMAGPLTGESLELLPALMTDWETWQKKHPDTTVVSLDRTVNHYVRNYYDHENRPYLVMEPRHPYYVIGLAIDRQARFWSFEHLQSQPVVNDELAGTSLLVLFDKKSGTAAIYDRAIDGTAIMFEQVDGQLVDSETGSNWDLLHARCVEGVRKGEQLTQLPGIVSTDHAWMTFHPATTSWSTNESESSDDSMQDGKVD